MTSDWSPSLAVKRRPRKFEDVVGRTAISCYLRKQARQRSGRSVLLHGPTGCGKTTLAEIYANALLCPLSESSPCLNCRDCDAFAERRHPNFRLISDNRDSDADIARLINDEVSTEAWGQGWSVILIDQADTMSENLLRTLHDSMERCREKVTFILCARQLDRLPRSTTSLFPIFEVGDADRPMRYGILERVFREEQIEVDISTLQQLARASSRCIREMIRDLESIIDQGSLTVVGVQDALNDGRPTFVERYLLRVLERKPFTDQMMALNGWDASGEAKTKAIRDTLACIFAEDVALSGESQDEDVSRLVRQKLVDRVAVRAMARKMEVRSLWRNILTTWRSEPGMDEALLPLIVSQFDEFLNGGDTVAAGEPGDGKGRKRRTGLSRFEGGRAPESAAFRVINATARTRRNHWLDQDDVRKIWDAASFMVQRYGVLFNTRILINYARLGIHDNVTMTKFHTNLIYALRDRFRQYPQTPSGDPQHHWLYVHETVGSGRFRTQFAAHFPPSSDDTIAWLHRRFSRWTDHRPSPGGVNIALRDLDWNGHLKLVRSLCRGIDPNIHVPFTDSNGTVYQKPLADILGIRTLIRGPIGGKPGTQRKGMSTSINETEWARSGETLPPLFAFDACDWARIASGWECEEARYRRELVRRRQELEQRLDVDYPEKGDSSEGQERVKAYEDHLQRWMAHAAIREGNRPGMEGAPGKPARD